MADFRIQSSQLAEGFRAAFADKTQRNLLLLSGGGSYGAWGAGVLNGWSRSGNPPRRPAFDVVTGVSTGAIQATPAFLGSDSDPVLQEAYTTLTTGQIYGRSWLPPSLLQNLDPLRRLLEEKYLVPSVIDAVADASAGGTRRLYVGTVDLASGEFCSWDLTQLAMQREYDLYRAAILASTANPAFLWPIEIDGAKHADGGICHRVFLETTVEKALAAHRETRSENLEELRVHLIVNGRPAVAPAEVGDWSISVMLRGLQLLMAEGVFGSLYQVSHQLEQRGPGGDGWELLLSWIPDGVPLDFPEDEFVPGPMKELFETAMAWGEKNEWETELPRH